MKLYESSLDSLVSLFSGEEVTPGKSGQDKSGQGKSGQGKSGYGKSGYGKSG